MNKSAKRPSLFILPLLLLFIWGCNQQAPAKKVALNGPVITDPTLTNPKRRPLKIAVAAMISPQETFISYRKILDYINARFAAPVVLVQKETYAEVNDLIYDGAIDAAFVCTGAYIAGHRDHGMELLVAPVAYGRSLYYSYIIVSANSKIKSLAGLRGKKFAFTDPLSNTGKLAPTYMLAKMQETPDTFFSKYIFTYSHDNSITAVAKGLVDGAAVDSLVWDYLAAKKTNHIAATKIIEKSVPFGIPPVVVPKGLDINTKMKLKNILLNMHKDKEGKAILAAIMIDRFTEVDDHIYDSVREMNKWLQKDNNEISEKQ